MQNVHSLQIKRKGRDIMCPFLPSFLPSFSPESYCAHGNLCTPSPCTHTSCVTLNKVSQETKKVEIKVENE